MNLQQLIDADDMDGYKQRYIEHMRKAGDTGNDDTFTRHLWCKMRNMRAEVIHLSNTAQIIVGIACTHGAEPEGWWCSNCNAEVPPADVTYDERHDERRGGCGFVVGSKAEKLDAE